MKTHLAKIPEISTKRTTMTTLPNSSRSLLSRTKNMLGTFVSNKTSRVKRKLGNLYTSAGYIFYTADQRRVDEANRKHGDKYLIKLFPQHPRLVLQEFETISQDRFRELYNDFMIKYEKDLPNIRKTIKDLRERAMELRRYQRYMDDPRESDASKRLFSETTQKLSLEFNKLTDDFVDEIMTARNKSMVSLVHNRGTRRNGTRLSRLRGVPGNQTLKLIKSYI